MAPVPKAGWQPCAQLGRWAVLLCALAAAASLAGAAPHATPVDPAARLASALADPTLAARLHKTGQGVASFCANCHGAGGNSSKPDVPNLAGQNTSYLFEQMRAFAEGRRKDTFMEGLIKAMSTDEKVGAALFYAGQAVAPQTSGDAALVGQGQALYAKTCARCHGAEGRGNEQIARIAGQQREYLRLSLQRYRAGTGPRVNALMQAETKLLTNPQIDALVAYVSSMR